MSIELFDVLDCARFRILLKSSGSGIQELCARLHLESPEGLLPRKIWTTPQLRQLYEPALVRALLLYEIAVVCGWRFTLLMVRGF